MGLTQYWQPKTVGHLNADIENVLLGSHSDPGIIYHSTYSDGNHVGSCFPKNFQAFEYIVKKIDCDTPFLQTVETINNHQKNALLHKINNYFDGCLKEHALAICGLAFKPKADDFTQRLVACTESIIEIWRKSSGLRP